MASMTKSDPPVPAVVNENEDEDLELPDFAPMAWSLSEIRATIPPHLFNKSTSRSIFYLGRDLAMAAALWAMATRIEPVCTDARVIRVVGLSASQCFRWFLWATYWWFQGLIFTGLWVIGHECGHNAFSSNKVICDVVGFIIHSCLWTPYLSWKISHHRHHRTHASMEKDEVYVPKTRDRLGIPLLPSHKINWDEYFGDTPIYTLLMLIGQQFLAFPAYLLFNVSGQTTYPQWTSHFSTSSVLFTPNQRNAVILSNLGLFLVACAVTYACRLFGASTVVKYYGIPWLAVTHWFVMITYLHHTDRNLPHYGRKQWNYQRGAAATVDRDFLGWQGRLFLHDVAHFHVVHHFFPQMPWYHGEAATRHLKALLGDHYVYSDKPVFRALWDTYNDCQFVEDRGDILFYKDKRGRAARRAAVN